MRGWARKNPVTTGFTGTARILEGSIPTKVPTARFAKAPGSSIGITMTDPTEQTGMRCSISGMTSANGTIWPSVCRKRSPN